MCSVVGYIGKNLSRAFVFEGLARLEYRGYDSAGFACFNGSSQKIECVKSSGQLSNLVDRIKDNPINGFLGIGHTRWSTHGDFSEKNAHPHFDCMNSVFVVHNGIIENHEQLRQELEVQGHHFLSHTDSEVIPHLFEAFLSKTIDIGEGIKQVVQVLQGAYAFIVMIESMPDLLIAVRKKSPLCIGLSAQETFIASDVIAFAQCAQHVIFLPDESYALIYKDDIKIYAYDGTCLELPPQSIESSFLLPDKGEHKHFMLKEIYEQPAVIESTVTSLSLLKSDILWNQCGLNVENVKSCKRIALIGCGTSWHAAKMAQFFFEEVCAIPVDVYLASEFRYMSFFPDSQIIYIFISQSGETADTLEALRLVNSYDSLRTIVVTNVASSTMVREAHGFLLTCAGVEVAVASTKAFSTQLTVLYWLAHRIGYEKHVINYDTVVQAEHDLILAGHLLESSLLLYKDSIENELAARYAEQKVVFFLGKHVSYPLAMESALKLKEISYIFAESYPVGELKHGPLALVDESMVIYIFSHQDPLMYQKLLSGAHAIKSRGGRIISFLYEGQQELQGLSEASFIFPYSVPFLLGPLVMTGLMQFFVYSIANIRGCAIDKPRNLAKSVTVE